jgi:hypothetical protein
VDNPPVASQQGAHEVSHHSAQADATDNNALHDNALDRELQLLREMLDAMREDRDAWREQARKADDERRELTQRLDLAAPIAPPASQPAAVPEATNQRRWWQRKRAR